MMHLVATNACIVVRTLVKESAREIFLSQHSTSSGDGPIAVTSAVHFSSIAAANLTDSEVRECRRVVILGMSVKLKERVKFTGGTALILA